MTYDPGRCWWGAFDCSSGRRHPHGPGASRGDGETARQRRLAPAVRCVSLLVVNLNSAVLNTALPRLVRDLHATSSQLQWTWK
jgi:hypothetical protein